jgi:putative hemolysin
MIYLEIGIVAALISINGLLAMSEIAVVSTRPARLKAMEERGVRGARRARARAAGPGRLLSTVQIGITLVGILSGAFSGTTLGVRLAELLVGFGLPAPLAQTLGVGAVVAAITYCALIIGELVPKQIALRDPEGVAARVAPLMTLMSRIAAPIVWVLNHSGKLVLRAVGQNTTTVNRVTDEEIAALIAEAETSGVIAPDERRLLLGVMRLADRTVRSIMSPRVNIDWIDLAAGPDQIRQSLIDTQHSHLPAGEGSMDSMSGVVRTRDLLSAMLADKSLDPRGHVLPAPIVHEHTDALKVLATLRESDVPLALVLDEYGAFEGVVTPADILEAIAGVFRFEVLEGEPHAVQREDGSWLLAGTMPAERMAETLGLELPERRGYETVAGFVLSHLDHLPTTGETVDDHGWRFEVVDMDGRRVDKILATRLPDIQKAS